MYITWCKNNCTILSAIIFSSQRTFLTPEIGKNVHNTTFYKILNTLMMKFNRHLFTNNVFFFIEVLFLISDTNFSFVISDVNIFPCKRETCLWYQISNVIICDYFLIKYSYLWYQISNALICDIRCKNIFLSKSLKYL